MVPLEGSLPCGRFWGWFLARSGPSGRIEQVSLRSLRRASFLQASGDGMRVGVGPELPSSSVLCLALPPVPRRWQPCSTPSSSSWAQPRGSSFFTQAPTASTPTQGFLGEGAGRADLPSPGGCETLDLATAIPFNPSEKQQMCSPLLPRNKGTSLLFQAAGPAVGPCNLLAADSPLKKPLDPCHVGSLGSLRLRTLGLEGALVAEGTCLP